MTDVQERPGAYSSIELRDLLRDICLRRVDAEAAAAKDAPAGTPARSLHLTAASTAADLLVEFALVFGFDPPGGVSYPELGGEPVPSLALVGGP